MYFEFMINVIEVLFFCGVFILIQLSVKKKYSSYLLGMIFGLISIIIMNESIMVAQGRYFDFRHITLTMAGFIGGPMTALIAAVISSVYRYNLGGVGWLGGITTIVFYGGLGVLLGKYFRETQNGKKFLFWFITGAAMTIVLLIIIAYIPPGKSDSLTIVRLVAGPFLILTPLATTIIFNFYFWAYGFLSKTSMLNAILKLGSVNLLIADNNGTILLSENLKKQPDLVSNLQKYVILWDRDNDDKDNNHYHEIGLEDGRYFVADMSGFSLPNGKPACVAVVTDITDRKREQVAMRRARDRFAKVFELSPHMMTIIRKSDYRYVDVNQRFLEERGFTRNEIIGKTPIKIGVPESELNQLISLLQTQGIVQNFESTMATKQGNIGWVILSAQNIYLDSQECILIAYNDVSEMKRMQAEIVDQLNNRLRLEEELSRSNQLISDIIANMADAFFVMDNDWKFTYANTKAAELLLKPREELLRTDLWNVAPQGRGSALEINYRKVKAERRPVTFEWLSVLHKNTWFRVNAYPIESGIAVFYIDITEKKMMREELIKSERQMTSILESMTDCFFAINKDWEFTYVNSAGEKAFGKSRDELLGRKMTEVFKVNDIALENYHKVLEEKTVSTFEIISEALENKYLEVNVYPSEDGLTCYFRDITNRKMAEKEIARLDRLNLVGQMAAGIGHEIRNPMTTVRGYLQLLGTRQEFMSQKSVLDLMISELDRANSIITEYLTLAKTKPSKLESMNLNEIINKLYPLIQADAFNQNKQIDFILGELPNLELDKKEITQLVLNLTRNGLEAMEDHGLLTIQTYVEGNVVILKVKDEGCGILHEDLDKLGTPFFTTKGDGTGLGLATSYRIAESHNAKIDVHSGSSGTTFSVRFLCAAKNIFQ